MLKKQDKEYENGVSFLNYLAKILADFEGKKRMVLFLRFVKGSFFELFKL